MDNILPSYDEVVLYVYDQFSLAFNAPKLSLLEVKSLCVCSEGRLQELNDIGTIEPTGRVLYKSFEAPVFFGIEETYSLESVVTGKVPFDVFLNAFLLMSGLQEWWSTSQDKHGRFSYQDSLQCKFDFVETPAVTIYFEFLAEAVRQQRKDCAPVKFKNKLVFTHDIDQIRSGWFEDIGYYIKNPSFKSLRGIFSSIIGKVFRSQDSYHAGLKTMQKIDLENNVDAISFLMTDKSTYDADYHLENLVNENLESSQRIGLHPGFFTYNNKQLFAAQLNRLEKLFPKSERIVRQHFLKYNVIITNKIHEDLKITEDYSLGFAEQYGFRNSIATPFHLYRFDEKRASRVVEVPLYFMDGTLHHYLNDNTKRGKQEVINKVSRLSNSFNCQFSLLFHNSVFTNQKYEGFLEMYLKLLAI